MKSSRTKPTLILYYILLILAAVLVLVAGQQKHKRVNFTHETLFSLNADWIYTASDGSRSLVSLPANLDTHDSNTVILTHRLPASLKHVNALGILTDNQSLTVYLDETPIYSRIATPDKDHLFNLPVGSIWDIINLPEQIGGKTLTLVITSKYQSSAGKINDVHIGTRSSILLHNIKSYGFGFLLSILIFILGMILLAVYVLVHKLIGTGKSIYHLGWFFFLSSIWLLTESNLSQLFISNPLIISALCYLSLFTLPLPLLFHINELEDYHFKRINKALVNLILGCDLILFLLQILNIADFHEALSVYRIFLFMVFTISMITLWMDYLRKKEKNLMLITYAITNLFLFSLLEFANYELKLINEIGLFFRIGLYLFIFILTINAVRKAIDVIKLSETASRYKLLATRDPLTNCRSRAKYMRDMERIDLSRNITIFMADMNNMKEINDTYGHHAGDEVIILSGQCLMKVFGHRVYRLGGDEFVCIEYNMTSRDIEYLLAALTMECDRINSDGPYKVDLSIGYATYDRSLDSTIYDTVKRADAMMYQIKEKTKELRSDPS